MFFQLEFPYKDKTSHHKTFDCVKDSGDLEIAWEFKTVWKTSSLLCLRILT